MNPETPRSSCELDFQQIMDLISPYPCISFDIFDTLIKRDVSSLRDTLKIMRKRYKEVKGKELPFYFHIEHALAPYIAQRKYNREASLDNMYSCMHVSDKEYLKELECQVELDYITANPVIYKIYLYCRDAGKKIYAISDMYLPKDRIVKMLKKCGYDISDVYISQNENANKLQGTLFEAFLKDTGLNREDVIHIGDNFNADVEGANKQGIAALKIPNQSRPLLYNKVGRHSSALEKNILHKFISNRCDLYEGRAQQIGFEVLGPALYYYTKWMNEQVEHYKIEKVFFLSRDAYVFMKAYEAMFGPHQDKYRYIYISRKAAKDALDDKEKKALLIKYLQQEGFCGRIAVVDIGWRGSTQKIINEIVSGFAEIHGFYFGTFDPFKKNVDDGISKGYFEFGKFKSAQMKVSSALFDFLLSDTRYGSTLGYIESKGEISPYRAEASFNNRTIDDIQTGALEFVKAWDRSPFREIELPKKFLFQSLLNLSFYPSRPDVDLIKDQQVDFVNYSSLSKSKGAKYYTLHLIDFLKDLRNTCWKGGFLQETFHNRIWNQLYVFFNTFLVMLEG